MQLGTRHILIALAIATATLCAGTTHAAPPQVPALPSQPAGYVAYAVDNFPPQYLNGPLALSNTPEDNPITDAGATLGRVLFYDKRLSHDNSTSCASCHKQSAGFSDTDRFSTGINGQLTTRHSPGLSNVVFYESGAMFWDERAASIEDQALQPIQSAAEMGSTLPEVVAKLTQTTFYPTLFQAAFGSPEVTPDRIARSIAQFERSMISYNSKFDAYLNGQATLTPAEQAGESLFNGIARCSACHSTAAHVSDTPRNIGLDATVTDPGAGSGRFKTPSLRNIEVRGHFMHDGRFSTLEEVVEFYNSQVQNSALLDPRLLDPLRLNLSPEDVSNIAAFMRTFTDQTFLTSSLFSDPFATLQGDYNGDGVVNQSDYDVWRNSFGSTASLSADGNGNSIVDSGDYIVWRANLGRTWLNLAPGSGAGGLTAAIPEPATLVLLCAALPLFLARRRSLSR